MVGHKGDRINTVLSLLDGEKVVVQFTFFEKMFALFYKKVN